mgnify:CR=1 FL=1
MTFKEHWLMVWHGYMSYLEEHKRCLSKCHLDNKELVKLVEVQSEVGQQKETLC